MTVLAKPINPLIPTDEMARLHAAGFNLLPLGAGTDGKSPMIPFNGQPRLPLKRILAPMHRSGSTCYGIRLNGLAVIDCDEDNPGLVKDMEARFGASPVHVLTPRGRHLYYRSDASVFPNLRNEGLPVDIKRGSSSYVLGPFSVRPDGGQYAPADGTLGDTALFELQLPASNPTNSRQITEGSRNYSMTVEAIQMVEYVNSPDELVSNLKFLRDDQCENPDTLPDSELEKIAAWAWSRRLEGKVYHGRNSEFRLHREALDALRNFPNASDAIALFVTLQDQHGHIPARTFPLDHIAMKHAGYTDLSRRRFLDARRTLESAGLIDVAANHSAANHRRAYRLKHLRASLPKNVSEMRPANGEGV